MSCSEMKFQLHLSNSFNFTNRSKSYERFCLANEKRKSVQCSIVKRLEVLRALSSPKISL